jgi:hypothetical protein
MVNLETLLSPSGGYNYENTISNTSTGLALGLLVDRGLYHKFIAKPLLQDYYRETRPEYTRKTKGLGPLAQPGGIQGAINRARNNLASTPVTVVGKHGRTATFSFGPSQEEAARAPKEIENLERAKKKLKVDRRNTGRQLKNKLKADKRFVRGAAWTMLVSFGLDMAIEGFTPGISKVAAQRDEQAMGYSNPLDSPASYTMRQRAVMAIHDSMMSVRNVMGNEAQFMHR